MEFSRQYFSHYYHEMVNAINRYLRDASLLPAIIKRRFIFLFFLYFKLMYDEKN